MMFMHGQSGEGEAVLQVAKRIDRAPPLQPGWQNVLVIAVPALGQQYVSGQSVGCMHVRSLLAQSL
jgi:hypothetical protein